VLTSLLSQRQLNNDFTKGQALLPVLFLNIKE